MRQPVHLLLVEDNAGDVKLTQLALERAGSPDSMSVVGDGVEALRYLRREEPYGSARRPDLVLLDLNLPRMDGREVLQAVKGDLLLCQIPIVILTSSQATRDIEESYGLHANCYITKPAELKRYMSVVGAVIDFWGSVAELPRR